ncbi:AAEL017190-PA [Aedes aegypti]|uniref:AAEL017190-PA n=1 Tax=Aedes aegypti TaxID=7159 RepID=J9HJI7_AEDAE|nr:AAEL017190-PA [Aedes aegypti]
MQLFVYRIRLGIRDKFILYYSRLSTSRLRRDHRDRERSRQRTNF